MTLNFLTTSLKLARGYREAGFSPARAERLARGQALIAKLENAGSVDELRDVMRDLIRDLYELGHPVPPWAGPVEGEDHRPSEQPVISVPVSGRQRRPPRRPPSSTSATK